MSRDHLGPQPTGKDRLFDFRAGVSGPEGGGQRRLRGPGGPSGGGEGGRRAEMVGLGARGGGSASRFGSGRGRSPARRAEGPGPAVWGSRGDKAPGVWDPPGPRPSPASRPFQRRSPWSSSGARSRRNALKHRSRSLSREEARARACV